MRPRVFPAEDERGQPGADLGAPRFNEAAGIPRGRPAACGPGRRGVAGFNEAAGIPRGRLAADLMRSFDNFELQ